MSAIWNVARLTDQVYPQLRNSLEVDTIIIGAGVTGLTTALKLAEANQRVAVLEAWQVGSGSSGGSTGNLYSTVSQGLASIRAKWDDEVIGEVVALRRQAIDFIEDTTGRFGIKCDFARRPLYFCVSRNDKTFETQLQEEYAASLAADLPAALVSQVPGLPFPVEHGLRLENQAQYNPVKYAQGLAKVITDLGGLIFEDSRVCEVDADAGAVMTEHGEIRARHIVYATHTPKGVNLLQAEMQPYREYGVSAKPPQEGPQGIFWVLDHAMSIRSYSHDNEQFLVLVGAKHKTGHEQPDHNGYTRLRDYAQSHFSANNTCHQWSAQQYKSADLLPYIGRSGHNNVYVATGFAADGLTWGTVAGAIISEQILGRTARGAELFNPRRFTPMKSAKNWARENAAVTKQLVEDYLTKDQLRSLEPVAPGEGKIVSLNGESLAVYRSLETKLSVLSPICPHMKCKVHWNGADSTWDCPCHGSRFATDGSVIEGPSFEPLATRKLPH